MCRLHHLTMVSAATVTHTSPKKNVPLFSGEYSGIELDDGERKKGRKKGKKEGELTKAKIRNGPSRKFRRYECPGFLREAEKLEMNGSGSDPRPNGAGRSRRENFITKAREINFSDRYRSVARGSSRARAPLERYTIINFGASESHCCSLRHKVQLPERS